MAAPNVASIPPAVQRAGQRADEIHRAVYGPQSGTPAGDGPDSAPAEPPAAPAPAPAPAETPAPAPAPAEPVPAPEASSEDWKKKYDTLKGKYNKEIMPLQNQLRDSNARMRELGLQVESLQGIIATMETSRATPTAPAAPAVGLITDADIEEFGADTIELVRRAVREEQSGVVTGLQQKISQLEAQLAGVGQQMQLSGRDRLFATLDSQVANWRELNVNDEFLNWLAESDPYSGQTRHDLLKVAFERNDAARVVNFFNGFLTENAVLSGRPPAQGGAGVSTPRVNLDTLVAPGRPREGSVRAQEGNSRIWTRAEVSAFYRDVQNRKFVGREEERNRIEREIFAASNEGRVR